MRKLRLFAVLPVLMFAFFGLGGAALAQESEESAEPILESSASVSGNVFIIHIDGSGNIVVIGDTVNLGDLPAPPVNGDDDANGDDAVDNGDDANGDDANGDDANGDDANGDDAVDNGDDANGNDDAVDNGDDGANGNDDAVDNGDDANGDDGANGNDDANGNGDESDPFVPFGIQTAPVQQDHALPPGIERAPGLNGMDFSQVPGQMDREDTTEADD